MEIQPNTSPETELVHVWPNGTWCLDEDLSEYLTFMSDDYESLTSTPEEVERQQDLLVQSIKL